VTAKDIKRGILCRLPLGNGHENTKKLRALALINLQLDVYVLHRLGKKYDNK
jgi:hypothetical protein